MMAKVDLKLLDDWLAFNTFLKAASEDEALQLLVAEQTHRQRTDYLLRAQGRFNKMRGQRERKEILSKARR
jgi:hypothetical protein